MFSKRVEFTLRHLLAFPECRRSVCTHSGAYADLQMNIRAQCASHHPLGPGVSVSLRLLPVAPQEQLKEGDVTGRWEFQR